MRYHSRTVARTARGAMALMFVSVALGCSPAPPSDADYITRMTTARAEKDAALRSQSEPIPEPLKAKLLPLAYFAIDPKYNIAAAMTPSDNAPPRPMIYSDGAVRNVRRVGTLKFLLDGQALQLGAFVEAGASERSLFIPFGDLTNGQDTYGGGRLLDVQRTGTGLYELDFNKAYNPSCYYSPSYSCPVPPNENRLPVAVSAGERVRATP